MTEDDFFEELRREYLAESPARLAELRKDLAAAAAGEADAVASLRTRFHRLAGSGGSYGFPAISEAARAAEQWLLTRDTLDERGLDHIAQRIADLAAAMNGAAGAVSPLSEPVRRRPFGWLAAVVGAPGTLGSQVSRVLEGARYAVRHLRLDFDPGAIPVAERPDVAVLLAPADSVIEPMLAAWTEPPGWRPMAVVLITAVRSVRPLEPPWSAVDHVVAPDRVETELWSLVRQVGRAATTPPSVLLLDPDAEAAGELTAVLEAAGARVIRVPAAAQLGDLLEREPPDLVIAEWQLEGAPPGAALREARRLTSHRPTPIVVHTARAMSDEEIARAVESGADAVISKSGSRALVARRLLARVERARRTRAATFRDDLTGLPGFAAMLDALDGAVSEATRAGQTFALIVLDLDHFGRINDRWGFTSGDRLLARVAAAVRGGIRASDFAARLGGGTIGVLARRCDPDHATRVADKIRDLVRRAGIEVDGERVSARASAGVSRFPGDGATTRALLTAAERAMLTAKATGRDRAAEAAR